MSKAPDPAFKIPAKPGTSGKRVSLTEKLDRIREHSGGQLEFIQAVVKKAKDSKGFRHHAPKTMARQDYHLSLYKKYICLKYDKQEATVDKTELEALCFPSDADDFESLYENMREFMTLVYEIARPRSLATGEHISYRTLSNYRDSMIFWVARTYRLRKAHAPHPRHLAAEVSEAMRGVYSQYKNTFKKAPKPYLGLVELRQLIDHEMFHNHNIENSEQHQAAWCLARITACRPGSICAGGKYGRNPPLKWKDVTITRTNEKGKFNVVVKFEDIRIKAPSDPEESVMSGGDQVLEVIIESPEPTNITLSFTHRLLVIAIRRGLLANIHTLDDLFNDIGHEILIKQEHLEDPLFYRSQPKGTGIDTSTPLTAIALTDYLKLRGYALGYTQGLTMYAIRRRAATDMVATIGVEATRRALGHAPDTFTLERYYMSMASLVRSTSIAFQEADSSGAYSRELIKTWAPLAGGKLTEAQHLKTRGVALRIMTDKLIMTDENPPDETTTPAELKQYRKRMRRIAQMALIDEQKEFARKTLTQADFVERQRQATNATFFAEAVRKRAIKYVRDGIEPTAEEDSRTEEEDEAGGTLFVDEAEPDLDFIVESHYEGIQSGRLQRGIERDADEETNNMDDDALNLPYAELARSFMDTIMDNSLTTHQMWSDKNQTCPECQDDPSVDDARKEMCYQTESHLENHMFGNFHSAHNRWTRIKNREASAREDKSFVCDYCVGAGSDAEKAKYGLITHLRRHIKKSNEQSHGAEHDKLKAEDGWYLDDFAPAASEETKKKKTQLAGRNMEKLGFKVQSQRQLSTPEPFPGFPGVVRGGQPGSVPAKFARSLVSGPMGPPTARISASLTQGVRFPSIPEDFANSLVASKKPPVFKRVNLDDPPTSNKRSRIGEGIGSRPAAQVVLFPKDPGSGSPGNKGHQSGAHADDPMDVSSGTESESESDGGDGDGDGDGDVFMDDA